MPLATPAMLRTIDIWPVYDACRGPSAAVILSKVKDLR
jgi:hypothetical protein